jgi:ribosomal protein L16/L10AE
MRQAFGKALGKAARVYIGKTLFSVRSTYRNVFKVVNALDRARAK